MIWWGWSMMKKFLFDPIFFRTITGGTLSALSYQPIGGGLYWAARSLVGLRGRGHQFAVLCDVIFAPWYDWPVFGPEGSIFKVGLGFVMTCFSVTPDFSFCEGIILGSKLMFGNGGTSFSSSSIDLSLICRVSAWSIMGSRTVSWSSSSNSWYQSSMDLTLSKNKVFKRGWCHLGNLSVTLLSSCLWERKYSLKSSALISECK